MPILDLYWIGLQPLKDRTCHRCLLIFIILFFYPEAKSAGELAAAGKGGGTDGVVQLPAEGDLEMELDMATAAKAVGDR